MIIAQAPAKEELNHYAESNDGLTIKMPIPLCGPAGQIAQQMLEWADIREGDYILTNAVKKGTFKDNGFVRPPTEEEILAFREELVTEIAKVNPQLIITLGKEALWSLCYYNKASLDEFSIGPKHGIDHKISIDIIKYLNLKLPGQNLSRTYTIIPLYHPAAILRDKDNESGYKEKVTQVMNRNKERISTVLGRFTL